MLHKFNHTLILDDKRAVPFDWSGQVCDNDVDFYLLHGALLLFAWMVVVPLGIFYARQDAVLLFCRYLIHPLCRENRCRGKVKK